MDDETPLASDVVPGYRGGEVEPSFTSNERRPVRFNPDRRAGSKRLKALIETFRVFLTAKERELGLRARRRTPEEEAGFRSAVEAISCNLLAVSMLHPETRIAVPRDNSLMAGAGKGGNPVYGRHFIALLDLLSEAHLGLIDGTTGHRGGAGKKGVRTLIAPLPALAAHLPLGAIEWGDLRSEKATEVLVLKSRKDPKSNTSRELPFEETGRTRQYRREVERLNKRIAAADVTVLKDGEHWPADPTDRSLRRIFNNETWNNGGRLFGGFWEIMRRKDRFEFIRIEGEPILEVDYGQLFPRLAYARTGTPPPDGDLYEALEFPQSRSGWKKIVNAMLFAEKRLTAWPEGTKELMPEGMRPAEAYATVERVHAPIAGLFWTGVGYALMFAESVMLLNALEGLAKSGIVALPVHDAVIVAASRAEKAREILQRAAERAVDLKGPMVKIARN